jgi:hypothetical protein
MTLGNGLGRAVALSIYIASSPDEAARRSADLTTPSLTQAKGGPDGQAAHSLTIPAETRKLAVLMRMALTYADTAGAEPDAMKRSELLDLCMTCWPQAQFLRR